MLFHGVNVVYKVDPYIPSQGKFEPQDSLNDEDIQNLADWGFNFVRLGVMWEAVERTEGVYDDVYLSEMVALVNKLGEKGIYTLIDMHQDVFARVMCGEGFPDFYAKKAISEHPSCLNRFLDAKLRPIFENIKFCVNMDWYNYVKDENDDPLISECNKRMFALYYSSP